MRVPHRADLALTVVRSLTAPLVFALSVLEPMAAEAQFGRTKPFIGHAPRVPEGDPVHIPNEDNRSGPRLGAAYIVGGSVTAEKQGRSFSPMTSLFGWQVEHQFRTGLSESVVPLIEFVGLVGGMEQSRVLPSATWMLGLRQPDGWEGAIGPMWSGAGLQLAFAAGITHRFGDLNVPLNLAVAPGRRGAAIALTTGFNRRGP